MSIVLEERRVKSCRKPWTCDGCGRSFGIGTPKVRQRNIGDDGPYVWQACLTCQGIVEHLYVIDHEGVEPDHIYEDMMQRFGSWGAADEHYNMAPSEDVTQVSSK